MKCKKCGKKLRRNETFCTVCGYYNDPNEKLKTTQTYDDDDFDLTNDDWSSSEDDKEEEKELDKILKEKKPEIEEELDEEDRYIKAYIGEDYKMIKKIFFNIWALLFSWIYFLYRKLYITGIIGLIITYIVIMFFKDSLLIYLGIVALLSGLFFNKYYIFIIKNRINKINSEFEGSDTYSIEDVCKEKGGVRIVPALIAYLIFLVIVILTSTNLNLSFGSRNNKYFKQNSENEANCNSLLKTSYSDIEENYQDYKLEEAECKISKNTTKEYKLFFKTEKDGKVVYFYYKSYDGLIEYIGNTLELTKLQSKSKLTDNEKERMNVLNTIKTDYDSIYRTSKSEDELIKKNKNTSEKTNFVFTRLEVIR